MLGVALVAGLIVPPILPTLFLAGSEAPSARVRLTGSRSARARLAARRRLYAVSVHDPPSATLWLGRPPLVVPPTIRDVPSAGRRHALIAGFYVNWDDNAFRSLQAHAEQLDWVIGEWSALEATGASVHLSVDRRVLSLVRTLPSAHRPKLMLMVTNYDDARSDFNPDLVRRLLSSPAHASAVIAQLVSAVSELGLSGVTLDFEEIPDDARIQLQLQQFVAGLGAALHRNGAVLSQAVAAELDAPTLQKYAALDDYVIPMLYDEHAGKHDVGPVASQGWYAKQAARAASLVPPRKLILGVGAYGYDWNDADPDAPGDEQSFQDVMRLSHEHNVPIRFDSTSLNPYLAWTEPDSTDHIIWYLDGVTAFNQMLVGKALGAAGSAVWRLGAEDPSMWSVIGPNGVVTSSDSLRALPAGYDVHFRGSGELLRIETRPASGRRDIRTERSTGAVAFEQVTSTPLPYVVQRSGNYPHRVALTFDDGPDGTWTPMILDTLRERHAPATFFLIGGNIERHIWLTRRIASEGHEVGNHTFTHPNLGLTAALITRLELTATERIIEATLGRQTEFFRPPYFGDAEPTAADELIPVGIATKIGYVTAGLHVDSDDWFERRPRTIISNVLVGRYRAVTCTDSVHETRADGTPLETGCSGSVVLLHDGGGDRAATVAAIGPLIDSLRAHGDTLVLLSALAGMTHEAAMPLIPPSSMVERFAELATFGTLGAMQWVLYWVFFLAVILGCARLGVVIVAAIMDRVRSVPPRRPARQDSRVYAPSVTVVVPAFKEERVIVKTIASLLAQDYDRELEVVVVDDGSPDRTHAVAEEAYRGDARVAVYRKENGGKASALNYGIARARGEIVVALDSDTVFRPDTVRRLVQPLADPKVGAVAGNAKVGNRINLVTRWQAVEYVTSQNLDRRALALFDCITVVPGAIGAWRKRVIEELGGFNHDTLAEDQDLTIAVHRAGYSVAYADDAIALTEAPDTLKALANQRFRWSFGTLQCMWKHRAALMRRHAGALGFIAMPNVWLFQLLFPAISPVADLMFVWSLVTVWLMKVHHGNTYALANMERILLLYGVFLLVDLVAAATAFLMEREEWRLLPLVLTQRFVYRQIMYLVVVRSFRAAIRGKVVGWGSLERKATVQLHPS